MSSAGDQTSSQTLSASDLLGKLVASEAERVALKSEFLGATRLVAKMHAAAVGRCTAPKRGVVEDVADVRSELDTLRKVVREAAVWGACEGGFVKIRKAHWDRITALAVQP